MRGIGDQPVIKNDAGVDALASDYKPVRVKVLLLRVPAQHLRLKGFHAGKQPDAPCFFDAEEIVLVGKEIGGDQRHPSLKVIPFVIFFQDCYSIEEARAVIAVEIVVLQTDVFARAERLELGPNECRIVSLVGPCLGRQGAEAARKVAIPSRLDKAQAVEAGGKIETGYQPLCDMIRPENIGNDFFDLLEVAFARIID